MLLSKYQSLLPRTLKYLLCYRERRRENEWFEGLEGFNIRVFRRGNRSAHALCSLSSSSVHPGAFLVYRFYSINPPVLLHHDLTPFSGSSPPPPSHALEVRARAEKFSTMPHHVPYANPKLRVCSIANRYSAATLMWFLGSCLATLQSEIKNLFDCKLALLKHLLHVIIALVASCCDLHTDVSAHCALTCNILLLSFAQQHSNGSLQANSQVVR